MNEIGGGTAIREESPMALFEAMLKMIDEGVVRMFHGRIFAARKAHSPGEFVDPLIAGLP